MAEPPKGHPPGTPERFWSKVDIRGDDECWEWTGALGANGYGRFKLSRWKTPNAGRVAWEIANGEALGARFACHTCDNRKCVNPAHIYAGDHASNTLDGVLRGRFKGRGNRRRVTDVTAVTTQTAFSEAFKTFLGKESSGGRGRD